MKIRSPSLLVTTSMSLILLGASPPLLAAPLPIVKGFEWQPFAAQVQRLIEAADFFGSPFSPDEQRAFATAMKETDGAAGTGRARLAAVPGQSAERGRHHGGAARPESERGFRL